MTGQISTRLAELGIELPQAPAPVAAYVPYVQTGNLVFISGQISSRYSVIERLQRAHLGIKIASDLIFY